MPVYLAPIGDIPKNLTRAPSILLAPGPSVFDAVVPPDATRFVLGTVRDVNGVPVVGATVLLFRTSDNFFCATTTSTEGGIYSFPRRNDDPHTYWASAYSVVNGVMQVHGASDRGLVPD